MRSTRARSLAVLVLVLLAACSASGTRERAARPQPVVLPAGGESYVVFDAGRIARHGPDGVEWQEPAPGVPSAAGYDLGSGWACVGYDDALAMVRLGGKRVERAASPLPGPCRTIGVHADVAALNAGGRVELVSIPAGTSEASLDASAWLAQFDLDAVDYALPTSACEVLLVVSRAVNAFTGDVRVLRASRCDGSWKNDGETALRGLTWVERCESDGRSIYVAGVFERAQPGALGRPGRLLQRLVVLKVDLATLRATELVADDRAERSTRVRDLAVGSEAVAVLLDSGELSIFAASGSDARLRREHLPGAEAVAWTGPGTLVVLAGGELRPLRYAD